MRQILALTLLLAPLRAFAQQTPPAADSSTPAPASAEDRIKALEDRLSKIEGAPAPVRINSFNPSIGMAIDAIVREYKGSANFSLRAAELNLEAPIDPFLKGWAVITGSNQGIDLEEAAMQTTKLPYSLQFTAGRFFAPFGRFSQWHDHELPMVDRPNSINAYVGGEGQADGVQLRYLVPTPFFLEAIAVTSNKLGTDNNRVSNTTLVPMSQWTHLGRLHASADLSDSISADLGASEAWTPASSYCIVGGVVTTTCRLADSWRTLSGADLTLRYQPSSGGLYHGVIWGTEVMQNDEQGFNPLTLTPTGRVHTYSGYTNIETKMGRSTRIGAFADLTALPDTAKRDYFTRSVAGYASYEFSEFNRIRIEYEHVSNNFSGTLGGIPGTDYGLNDLIAFRPGDIVMVQWTTVLGYHVHGFRGRWGT
jgi:hypothetical protein